MAHSNTTKHGLPLFIASDKPNWLTDFNGAMTTIDDLIDNTSAGEFDTLSKQVQQNTLDISQLKTKNTQQDSAIADNAGAISSTNTKLNALTTRVTNLEQGGSGGGSDPQLAAQVATNTQNITNLQSQVGSASQAAATAQNTANQANTAAGTAQGTANQNKTAISSLQTALGQTNSNVSSLSGRVSALEQGGGGSLPEIQWPQVYTSGSHGIQITLDYSPQLHLGYVTINCEDVTTWTVGANVRCNLPTVAGFSINWPSYLTTTACTAQAPHNVKGIYIGFENTYATFVASEAAGTSVDCWMCCRFPVSLE